MSQLLKMKGDTDTQYGIHTYIQCVLCCTLNFKWIELQFLITQIPVTIK